MRRFIATIGAWFRGWFTTPVRLSGEFEAAIAEADAEDDVSFDGDDNPAVLRTVSAMPSHYAPGKLLGATGIDTGKSLEQLRADSTALIFAAKRGINDEEIEAARRLRERSENAHKQPCETVIDARITSLTASLTVERKQRQELQAAVALERAAWNTARVRGILASALAERGIATWPEDTLVVLAEVVVSKLPKLKPAPPAALPKRSRAKQSQRKRRA